MTENEYIERINEISFEIHEFYQRIKDRSDEEIANLEIVDVYPNLYDSWMEKMSGRASRKELRSFKKVITLLNDEFTYIGKEILDKSTEDNSVFLINGKKF